MSVLRNVKERLQTVQDDIKSSFKLLTKKDDRNDFSGCDSSLVNIDAGAELLNRFQTYWAELHENAEVNAARAVAVDAEISSLLLFVEQRSLRHQQLSTELDHVPIILNEMNVLKSTIVSLDDMFLELEEQLMELEDVCDELEFRKNCTAHQNELHSYDVGKEKELKQLRVGLSVDHASKVRAYEQRRQDKMRERQEAFNDAFQADMEHYKKHGKIERSASTCSDGNVDIADIKLDEDEESALADFLEPVNMEKPMEEVSKDDEEEAAVDIEVKTDEDVTAELLENMKKRDENLNIPKSHVTSLGSETESDARE